MSSLAIFIFLGRNMYGRPNNSLIDLDDDEEEAFIILFFVSFFSFVSFFISSLYFLSRLFSTSFFPISILWSNSHPDRSGWTRMDLTIVLPILTV